MNLVRNYSFEDVVSGFNCANSPTPEPGPGNPGQSDLESYWNQIDYWECPERKLFCAGAGSADCNCDLGVARTGIHYGRCTSREYICQELSQTVNAGETFYYEFYVKGFGGGLFEFAGIKLFDERPKQCGYGKLDPNSNDDPQLKITNVNRDGVWHKVSGFLVADDTFNWITLGTFADDRDGGQTTFWDDIKIVKMNDCPQTWLFENNLFESENKIYQASDKIIAGEDVDAANINGPVVVKANSNIIFKAGNQVILESGFSSEAGAYFETVIEPCGSSCPHTPPPLNDVIICSSNPFEIGNANSETGLFYLWSPSTYLDNPNSPNPIFTPPIGSGEVEYTVTITNICGGFWVYGNFFPDFEHSLIENVTVNYNTNPNPISSVTITNSQTSDYDFNFDFTVGAETEEYCIEIAEQGTGNVVYSDCFDNLTGTCCNYNFNYNMINDLLKENFTVCKDYTIKIHAKNYCTTNLATDQFDWNRNSNLSIISVSNVFTPPSSPNEFFTAIVEGADEFDIYITDPSQSEIHDFSGVVTNNIVKLWDGWCDGASCTAFLNNECWASEGYYFYGVSFTNKCMQSADASGLLLMLHDTDPTSVNILSNCTRMALIDENQNVLDSSIISSAEIKIYPNPTSGIFNIEYSIESDVLENNLKVYDNLGRVVVIQNNKENTVDLSNFSNGIYFLEIKTNQGFFREKIIKQ